MDLMCLVSGGDEETVAHALFFCPAVQRIWFVSPLSLVFPSSPNDFGLMEWVNGFF